MMRLPERSAFFGTIGLVSASDGSCAAGSEPFGGNGTAHGGEDAQPRAKTREGEPRPGMGLARAI